MLLVDLEELLFCSCGCKIVDVRLVVVGAGRFACMVLLSSTEASFPVGSLRAVPSVVAGGGITGRISAFSVAGRSLLVSFSPCEGSVAASFDPLVVELSCLVVIIAVVVGAVAVAATSFSLCFFMIFAR